MSEEIICQYRDKKMCLDESEIMCGYCENNTGKRHYYKSTNPPDYNPYTTPYYGDRDPPVWISQGSLKDVGTDTK